MSENRVLRRIFGRNRKKVALYASVSIIMVIKLRRMRGVGNAERMEEIRNAYIVLVGRPEGKRTRKVGGKY
jgi:hypothetical protein